MTFIERMDQLEERLRRLEEEMAQLRRQKRVVSPKPKVETKARQRVRFTLVHKSDTQKSVQAFRAVQALFKKHGVESDPQNTEWGVVVEYSVGMRRQGNENEIRRKLSETKRSIYIGIYPYLGESGGYRINPLSRNEQELGHPVVTPLTYQNGKVEDEGKAWKGIVAAFKRTQK